MKRFAILVLAIAALPAWAQPPAFAEMRANVEIVFLNEAMFFNMTVRNNSTTAAGIEWVRLKPNFGSQAAISIDTFGTFSPFSIGETPPVGANADGVGAQEVTLTPVTPLLPGQYFRADMGDLDLGPLTNIELDIKFTGMEPALLVLTSDGVIWPTWSGDLTLPLGFTYPIDLTWVPPTQNEDGSPYTNPDGYKIYWGDTLGTYANSKDVSDPATLTDTVRVPPGAWYFVATAYNTLGEESDYSNVESGRAGAAPLPPSDLAISAESNSTAWLLGTTRNKIVWLEAGNVNEGAACDPQQSAQGELPSGITRTLNLVLVENVNLLPSIDPAGELAIFTECSVR